ncbi:hypothetical protein SAMN02745824_2003 [Parasphingorhabdus marina DSM 22363]|uniref:Uncharacterized protein n=1 Tax=Parasphingorhabdus marina DSM 22363 TaxID=1123272 RepID=A0A1N6EMR8_9SPHN|nr:hypothetical protein SAMN02745824_2003 [Parasphingorhabdus marina DSM 22363]
MNQRNAEIRINERDAKAGSRPQGMRWVLGISLFAALAAMSLVWIIPALN